MAHYLSKKLINGVLLKVERYHFRLKASRSRTINTIYNNSCLLNHKQSIIEIRSNEKINSNLFKFLITFPFIGIFIYLRKLIPILNSSCTATDKVIIFAKKCHSIAQMKHFKSLNVFMNKSMALKAKSFLKHFECF